MTEGFWLKDKFGTKKVWSLDYDIRIHIISLYIHKSHIVTIKGHGFDNSDEISKLSVFEVWSL